jgi:predicted alpha/beta hydrolase family esterase
MKSESKPLVPVFLAGIGNSGAAHWQRQWQARWPSGVWVEHASWDEPEAGQWVSDLRAALAVVTGPKLLVAHSLGCLVAAMWSMSDYDPSVQGAFLVAVPDPHGSNFPPPAKGFDRIPQGPLPMPSVIVASESDPYGSIEYARAVAERWQAQFTNVGPHGHINADSGLGFWPEGLAMLERHYPQARL